MSTKNKEFSGNIIIPYNPKKYDLEKAISSFPYVEWTQHVRPEIGKKAYIYIGKAGGKIWGQQLAYEMEIIASDVGESLDDASCLIGESKFGKAKRYFRMKIIKRIPSHQIKLQDLLDHGLSKYPQSQIKIPVQLQDYLDSVLNEE